MSHDDTNLLDDAAFAGTFAAPMRDVTEAADGAIDIWPYVGSIPASHLRGHVIFDRFVEYVYRDAGERFDHVMVMTKTKNVYLAVIVDLVNLRVYGHHLLDLNEKYGLASPCEG